MIGKGELGEVKIHRRSYYDFGEDSDRKKLHLIDHCNETGRCDQERCIREL